MRVEEFKMERENLLKVGEEVNIVEGVLPSCWYYTIVPAIAMSGNYKASERIKSSKGIVKEIEETPRGFFVLIEFEN